MKPGVDHTLMTFAGRFMERIVPDVGSEYNQTDASVMATLLAVAAEDYDKAADLRIRENEAIQALFVAENCGDPALSERLSVLATQRPENYRISTLQTLNETLNRALIDLHAWADEHDPALSVKIWALLKDFAYARRIELMG